MIKMSSRKLFIFCIIGLSNLINFGLCISDQDLYKYYHGKSEVLPIGDEKYEFIKLTTPIHLYSESYDHVYVNTNGLLSFRTEFVNYMNVPFPLENPAIAPFYANIDTTDSNETTTIEYILINDTNLLLNASELISDSYVEAHDFETRALFVATWQNVGHYNHNNDRQNTFQVVVICGDEETYVRFLYPQNGINWIQGDMGESGLPDVRAQVGFVSEDGRYFALKGSGTENVRHLSDSSNHGVAGSYLYRIGLVGSNGVIEEPDSASYFKEEKIPLTCAAGGKSKCHSRAHCFDRATGYCCKCNDGYYGNGFSCLLENIPLRVAGTLKGRIGSEDIDAVIQSYVVMNDGRSYTAITPIPDSISYSSQLLSILGETIGWLFSKPIENAINGYELTGGKLVRTSIIGFATGERLDVVQNFTGLNMYDQLDVEVSIQGDLPELPYGSKVDMLNIFTEYNFDSPKEIHHTTYRVVKLEDGKKLEITVDDFIKFEYCTHAFPDLTNLGVLTEKVSKISLVYMPDEKALRIGMLNRIGDVKKLSPCSSGNLCGPNTICVPDEEYDDAYQCICQHGFVAAQRTEEGLEYCVDIDECYGQNVCHANAHCINRPGGYDCTCLSGYIGNGYTCEINQPTNGYATEHREEHEDKENSHVDESKQDEHSTHNITWHDEDERPRQTHEPTEYDDQHEREHPETQPGTPEDGHERDHRVDEDQKILEDNDEHNHYNHDHEEEHEENNEDHRQEEEFENEERRKYDEENRRRQEAENEERRRYDEENRRREEAENEERRKYDEEHRRDEESEDEERRRYDEERRREEAEVEERRKAEHNNYQPDRPTQEPEQPINRHHGQSPRPDGVKISNVNINTVHYHPDLTPDNRFDPIDEYENCKHCSDFADCIDGECKCRDGWNGNGETCDYNCVNQNEEWDGTKCVLVYNEELDDEELSPFCTQNGCTCPYGYQLIEFAFGHTCRYIKGYDNNNFTDETSCYYENTCGTNADCAYIDSRYTCICNEGYDGDGYNCIQKERSCLYENICHEHATCVYDETSAKSVCKCNIRYEGNGFHCDLAPECHLHDDCGFNSDCDDGICVCQSGFERDVQDNCVPIGLCGGVFCVENAICQWDEEQAVSYCHCPEGFIGDGISACKSIPPQCNVRNNCGLNAHCVQNYRNHLVFECVCQSGFYGDGFICTPEENCMNIPSLCDRNARCHSTVSGLQCVCNEGHLGNGTYCAEIPKLDSGFLLISQGVAIVKVPYSGKRGQPLTVAQMAIGIDKDCATGRFYWSDITTRSIWSAKYDGTDKKPFITENLQSPEGITVDWISRRLYWTDSSKDTIEVADIDNSTRRAVIINKHLVNPRGIAVDPVQSKLYWSDWNRDAPKIEWANLDGTDRHILLNSPHIQLPNSLAVKHQTGELCFADAGTKKIECVYAPTNDIRTIAANLSYPFGLAVSEDHFYWTDWQTKKIESVDHYGTRKDGLTGPLFGSHKMYGMTATTEKCAIYHTQCLNNGECPPNRICLNNHFAPSGRSCKCISSSKCNEIYSEYQT